MTLKTRFILPLLLALSGCVFIPDFYSPEMADGYSDAEKGIAAFNRADYQQALQFLAPAAEKGDIDAQYMVGMIHLYGLAGYKNSFAAQKWLTLAAQAGQRAAQEQLAFLYNDELSSVYNPIDAYHWFSTIIADRPQYQEKLNNLEWTLRSRGLLATAKTIPDPKKPRYKGVDYNSLFPLR